MGKIVFGTTNKRKIADLEAVIQEHGLDIDVLSLDDIGWDRGEIEENGTTIEENSLIKARGIYDFLKEKGLSYPIISDDSGLFVDALNGAPGIYTARFADEELRNDPTLPKYQAIYKMLNLMKGEKNRRAKYCCAITVMDNDGNYKQLVDSSEGYIDEKVNDPIKKPYLYSVFVDKISGKPFNQLNEDELKHTYRYKAFVKIFANRNNDISVDPKLVAYIENNIFPEYQKNDKGHGILHIKEVIRRSFELKRTMNLSQLDDNLIYTIAACHDNGKYINHEEHEKIAAKRFYEDKWFSKYFSEEDRKIIREAIEDHRSSLNSTPRSDYGKLISSADRNSTIDIVFIRSFFVGQARTPDMTVEEFLDYTWKRLQKRYSKEHSENMFYKDDVYEKFLTDMRKLLSNEKAFKDRYCFVNNLRDRQAKIINEEGYHQQYSDEDKSRTL